MPEKSNPRKFSGRDFDFLVNSEFFVSVRGDGNVIKVSMGNEDFELPAKPTNISEMKYHGANPVYRKVIAVDDKDLRSIAVELTYDLNGLNVEAKRIIEDGRYRKIPFS